VRREAAEFNPATGGPAGIGPLSAGWGVGIPGPAKAADPCKASGAGITRRLSTLHFQESFMADSIAATTSKDVQKALARRLARRELKDDTIAAISKRIVRDGLKIGGVDFCPYGICIDYFSDKRILVDKIMTGEKYRVVRLFPYGILVDDLWRMQVEMKVPELEGIGGL
jgi:hypothetical protein